MMIPMMRGTSVMLPVKMTRWRKRSKPSTAIMRMGPLVVVVQENSARPKLIKMRMKRKRRVVVALGSLIMTRTTREKRTMTMMKKRRLTKPST